MNICQKVTKNFQLIIKESKQFSFIFISYFFTHQFFLNQQSKPINPF